MGLTQAELGHWLGVSANVVGHAEAGCYPLTEAVELPPPLPPCGQQKRLAHGQPFCNSVRPLVRLFLHRQA